MGLKQDIVLVNEFTVPTPRGGTRGATPGSYIDRYMARDGATEPLAPIRRTRTDDFIQRYMARESAVERLDLDRPQVKSRMRQGQGRGGVAFGYGSASLSHEELRAASRDIQKHFEAGHTVLKTVLSFDEEYLRRHGIVDEDFRCTQRGDYRGRVDQMRLRMAVMHGLDRMGTAGFDDLRYVGVIQIDTEHVHCHLAMVDAGPGRLAVDGTQKGKLADVHKSRLRRGLDAWLDEKQAVAHLSSAVGYERRNVTTYIKRWAHERIRDESLSQFLLACLPADRTLWRAKSNDVRMRKASRIVTELVEEQLQRRDSPMPGAMERVVDYANKRRENEGLSTGQWHELVDRGRDQIIERAVNGVYAALRALPERELTVRTPMLEVMGMDYEQAAELSAREDRNEEEDLVSFGFRLRSCATRLRHHKEKTEVNRDLARQWERAAKAEVVGQDSRPLYDFYRFQEEYHRRLVAKYQYFLPFFGDAEQWYDQQQALADYGRHLLDLTALRQDTSLQRMKDAEAAERIGREIYDQPGGGHLTRGRAGREVLDARIARMRRVYDERAEELADQLALSGLLLRAGGPDETDGSTQALPGPGQDPRVVAGSRYDFAEVKALDLHHLDYDFARDVPVGPRSARTFTQAAQQRHHLLLGAMDYLDRTGQEAAIEDLPVEEVAAMVRTSRDLEATEGAAEQGYVLRSRLAQLRAARAELDLDETRSPASPLDRGLVEVVRSEVDQAVTSSTREIEDGSRQPNEG